MVRTADRYPAPPPGATPSGTVPGTSRLELAVVLALPDPAAVAAAASAVATPGNPAYHHYLAPGQFAQRYGPGPATVAAVERWLRADGLRPSPAVDDLLIPFTATAAAVEHDFGVRLAQTRLPSGRVARVPDAAPLVPASLADAVVGISGLDTVAQPVSNVRRRPGSSDGTSAGPTVSGAAGPSETQGRSGAQGSSGTDGSSEAQGPSGTSASSGSAPSEPGARAADVAPADRAQNGAATACAAATATATDGAFTENQLAQLYDFDPLYAQGDLGQGVTVAAVELEPYLSSDVAAFERCFGLSTSVTSVSVDGGVGTGPGQGEAALDLEELAALVPDASVVAYEAPNTNVGTDDVYATIAAQDRAQVVTTSWSVCEALALPDLSAESTAFEQATLQGQTVLAASGDSGSEGCWAYGYDDDTGLAVDDPGTQPWVTAVGATTVDSVQSSGLVGTQSVWNDCQGDLSVTSAPTSCATNSLDPGGASGGGLSAVWAMPTYQVDAGLPGDLPEDRGGSCSDAAATTGTPDGVCRAVPDVASDGDPNTGTTVYYDGQWIVEGGTSMAAPLWAALVALADSGCGPADRVGELNPPLYRLASSSSGAALLDAVTIGDNDLTGTNGGRYAAGPGYNLATGWGTPVAAALVAALQPAGGCPVVDGLSATSGLSAGGSPGTVTITGANLSGATAVHFGSVAASAFTVGAGGDSITVVPPPSPAGPAAVTVTTPTGTSAPVAAAVFDYVGPVVTAVSPSSGPPTGGQTVTVNGSDLVLSSGGAVTVRFGGVPATRVVATSSTSVTVVSPPHAPAVVAVTVQNADGTSGSTPASAYTYTGGGYWLVARDGGVFAFGDAGFFGSLPGLPASAQPGVPVVGLVPTPDGGGYWEVTSAGDVYSFGDAGFFGSTGGIRLAQPVVGMAAT
jgi:subtilase family serine protease